MKKVLIITNVITLGFLFCTWFIGCKENNGDGGNNSPTTDSCIQTPSTEIFTFDVDKAKKMIATYTEDHWEAINNSTSTRANNPTLYPTYSGQGCMKDSRSVWFSLSRLKGFIHYIETQAYTNMPGNRCCEELGIRIYFAEYDNTNTLDDNTIHKTTVLLVPTYKWDDGKHHDFDPARSVTCGIKDTTWPTMTALMMNHGGVIPPPFPSQYATDGTNPIYKNSGADFMIYAVDNPLTNGPQGTPSGATPNPYWSLTSIHCYTALPAPPPISEYWGDK